MKIFFKVDSEWEWNSRDVQKIPLVCYGNINTKENEVLIKAKIKDPVLASKGNINGIEIKEEDIMSVFALCDTGTNVSVKTFEEEYVRQSKRVKKVKIIARIGEFSEKESLLENMISYLSSIYNLSDKGNDVERDFKYWVFTGDNLPDKYQTYEGNIPSIIHWADFITGR